MDKYFLTRDDIKLRYREDYLDNPKAVVIIVHGFAEHIGRYDYVAEKLNGAGYSVFRYDARGHGMSSGKKGHMNSYVDMVDDLYEIYNLVKNENPNMKIYTLAHSMGGNIAANFGIKHPNILAGQLFSGAALGYFQDVDTMKKLGVSVLGTIASNKYISNPAGDICSDQKVVEEYQNDPLVLKEATLGFFKEFSIKASKNIFDNTKNYNYPCYLGHGGDDRIISNKASKRFYDEISSEDKTIKIYPDLYHEIFNEKVKDSVIVDYIEWLDARV